jgi:hypothetical protein
MDGRPGLTRDWVVLVQFPTEDVLDSLATQVAEAIAGLTAPPEVRVPSLEVHSGELNLELHIRPSASVSSDQARVLAAQLLQRYAPNHDLSGTTISVRPLG